MIAASLLLSLVSYAEATDLASRVQIHMSAAAQPWLARNGRKLRKAAPGKGAELVFEIEVNKKGGLTSVTRSLSSGSRKVDHLSRDLFRVVPPLAKPPKSLKRTKRNIPCVVHLRLRGRPRVAQVTAVCTPAGGLPQVAWRDDVQVGMPTSALFEGWQHEAAGNNSKAIAAFRQAAAAAPDWSLASLTLGLRLARSGRLEDAQPLLRDAAGDRRVGREARRYLKGKRPRADRGTWGPKSGEVDTEADADVSDCQRDEGEIFHHVRKRFPRLSKCIAAEQKRSPATRMPPTIPVSFVIAPKGAVKGVAIDHRFFREGKMLGCAKKALSGKLAPRKGSNCPVSFDLQVQRISYTGER